MVKHGNFRNVHTSCFDSHNITNYSWNLFVPVEECRKFSAHGLVYNRGTYFGDFCQTKRTSGCPRGVMVKVMDCRTVVSEFVLQSRYYVQFRTNTPGKGMNPLILPAMG